MSGVGLLYYKLRSQLSFSTVTFDGHFVSVGEARRLIAAKMNLGADAVSELVLTDPRTGVEHREESEQLAKSTSVVVRRVPAGQQGRLRPLLGSTPAPTGSTAAASQPASAAAGPSQQTEQPEAAAHDEFGEDPFVKQAAALKAQQEAAQAQAAAAARVEQAAGVRGGRGGAQAAGRGRGRGRSTPHLTYVCPRCSKIGHHWVSDCPTQGDPAFDVRHVRQPAGIPQGKVVADPEGSILLPGGTLGQLTTNSKAYEQQMAQMLGTEAQPSSGGPAAGLEGAASVPQLTQGEAADSAHNQQTAAEEDDDALQAAAQPVKLLALPAPSTASTAAAGSGGDATTNNEDTTRTQQTQQAEHSSGLPPILLRPFCTPQEFMAQLPLLSAEGVLPSAAPRALLLAFGKGKPLTPAELDQLQAEERAKLGPSHHSSRHSSKRGEERSSKHHSSSHKRSSGRRTRSRSRSRSRGPSSRRSLKPHSTRHSDRDEQRGRVSSRDKESSRHRTRHHSREHSQQMDDEGLTAAAAPEDHMPGPDQLTNTTTAHFATQQGRRHKHSSHAPCEQPEHIVLEPVDAAAFSADKSVSEAEEEEEVQAVVGGEGDQAQGEEPASLLDGTGSQGGGSSADDRYDGGELEELLLQGEEEHELLQPELQQAEDEQQPAADGGEAEGKHHRSKSSSHRSKSSRHKHSKDKQSSRHKSSKRNRHKDKHKGKDADGEGGSHSEEDARPMDAEPEGDIIENGHSEDIAPPARSSKGRTRQASAAAGGPRSFIRNSLMGALEQPKHRSSDSRKRRHATPDDVPANGVSDAMDDRGEGRWGHDKFEEEFGEQKPRKSKRKTK